MKELYSSRGRAQIMAMIVSSSSRVSSVYAAGEGDEIRRKALTHCMRPSALVARSMSDSSSFLRILKRSLSELKCAFGADLLWIYESKFILDSFLLCVCTAKILRRLAAIIDLFPWLQLL